MMTERRRLLVVEGCLIAKEGEGGVVRNLGSGTQVYWVDDALDFLLLFFHFPFCPSSLLFSSSFSFHYAPSLHAEV